MKLPVLSWKDVDMILKVLGYSFDRQKGSHRLYCKKGMRSIPVPMHKELTPGTLKSIIRATGLERDEFLGYL